MAAFAKALVFLAVGVVGTNILPPGGFPCSDAPIVLESKNAPPNGQESWPAKCMGLTQEGSNKSTEPDCKQACIAKQRCSVWQLTDEDYCWLSTDYYQGTDCQGREGDNTFNAKAGQRLQHGYINVSETLTGAWFDGLSFVAMHASATDEVKKRRCKHQCYSDIYCKTWLYVTGVPTDTTVTKKEPGCHLQTRETTVGTKEQLAAGQTSAGELILHNCQKPVPPPPKKEDDNSNWWLWPLIIGLALLALLAIVALLCCMMQGKDKKKTKTRAVKVAPKKKPEPEVLQPLVPMPIVQQPMVTYTPTYQAVPQVAPPVFTQAPVVTNVAPAPVAQTYAAAPVVQSYSAVPMAATAPGGSVVVPAQGGSVTLAPAGGSVIMEQPRAF